MELRDLEYFAVVAEHGNVRRASEALGLSQPALSKSLRRLEKSLGAKLVSRTPKGVDLTTVGTALLSHVRPLRLSLDDVAREAGDLSQGRAGHLRVGAGPTMSEDLLPEAYAALSKDAPKLTLQIHIADNDVLVPALRRGELDLTVSYIPAWPYKDLVQAPLYDDTFQVWASADHRVARAKRLTLGDLTQERWMLPGSGILSRQWLFRVFQDKGLPPPQLAIETNSLRLRLHIAAASNLLMFASTRVMQRVTPAFRVKALPIRELTLQRRVGISYRKNAYLPPAAQRLIEILKSVAPARSRPV